MLKYFYGSLAVTVLGLALSAFLGGIGAIFITAVLALLEISLSFDNAVVNATVLKDMDLKWRRRFITWGMLLAVFGMRIIFPLLIVAVIAKTGIIAAFNLAVFEPVKYAETLNAAKVSVAAFGGAFLMMVFLRFFINEEKKLHWIGIFESPLSKLGRIEAIQMALVLVIMYVVSKFLAPSEQLSLWVSGTMGLVTFVVADGIGVVLSAEKYGDTAVKTGLGGFIYLELLDASFSFDGVIGAFAITNNFFIIAIGLGIGAMFVRSLTIMLVEQGTLGHFKYLEHAAFWAIGALAIIMFLGSFMHIPEFITGILSAAFIAAGIIHSIVAKKAIQTQEEINHV